MLRDSRAQDRLRAMIDSYYAMRGLDSRGHPNPADLPDLHLEHRV